MDLNKFKYYYNNVPGKGLCRNNLIYTSLINEDATEFCMWFYNDSDYHKGHNEVVDTPLMEEKFKREIRYLELMGEQCPDLIPKYRIDMEEKKIYLDIDGPDMWECAGCQGTDYSKVLPDWKEQMLNIIKAHKDLGLYKYSLHPSSYFVVDGKLKSINYFFAYDKREPGITIRSVLSHISHDRREVLIPNIEKMGLDLDSVQNLNVLQMLCFDSFKNNFDSAVMEEAKRIYV
jgi:hypothetical protein